VIISGCGLFKKEVVVPDIISVGECERGVVTDINLKYVQDLWPQADITDVLISGACYQDRFIKKR
jgi:hypothetical protein